VFRNINDLMTPILAACMVGIGVQLSAAVFACDRKYGNDPVNLFNGNQIPVGTLVTGLTTGIAFLGFLGTSRSELGTRSIG
jgi:hypothetical protein